MKISQIISSEPICSSKNYNHIINRIYGREFYFLENIKRAELFHYKIDRIHHDKEVLFVDNIPVVAYVNNFEIIDTVIIIDKVKLDELFEELCNYKILHRKVDDEL